MKKTVLSDWMKIGVVGKPYGLRGAFYVSGRSEVLQSTFSVVSLGPDPKTGLKSDIKEQKIHKSRSVLILTELKDRTAMEKHVGKIIWVPADKVEVDDDSEYLWKDLIGKKVVDSNRELVGVVKYVSNHGASDIVELENSEGAKIDIAFISAFFDMSFTGKDSELSLVVPKENFDDLWENISESQARLGSVPSDEGK